MMTPYFTQERSRFIFSCILLTLLSVVVYAEVLGHDFLNYDDNVYIDYIKLYDQGLFSLLGWGLTSVVNSNWSPVTVFSLIADYKIYGNNPAGFHFTNLLIHILNSFLVYLVVYHLSRATVVALLVAAVFIVHPLNVEPVAWIAERKGLFAAFFILLSVYSYIKFKEASIEKEQKRFYYFSILFFMLSLFSKATFVILPFLLILIDSYRENFKKKISFEVIKDKAPFFIIALIMGVVTIYTHSKTGAISNTGDWSFDNRVMNALYGYIYYLQKTLLPTNLAVNYVPINHSIYSIFVYAAGISGVLYSAYYYREKAPYFLFGILWFFITLLPVIGLIKSGNQIVADRYMYIPILGLLYVALNFFYTKVNLKIVSGLFVFIICVYGYVAKTQLVVWKDDYHVFGNVLKHDSDNYIAHLNLSSRNIIDGNIKQGLKHYFYARQATPLFWSIYDYISTALVLKNEYELAVKVLNDGLIIEDMRDGILRKIAQIRINQKKYYEAIIAIKKAIKIKPENEYIFLLGHALFYNKDYDEARNVLLQHQQLHPDNYATLLLLARIYKLENNQEELLKYRGQLYSLFPDRFTEISKYLD